MDLAAQAALARLRGNHEDAERLNREAFVVEKAAALRVERDLGLEPTRSVLFRSAAALAVEIGETREAERLASSGLMGEPPDELADELRGILEEVQFQRHLTIRGIRLLPQEFQISLVGNAIASGVAESDVLLIRVKSLDDLVTRTAERKSGLQYRRSGPKPREIRESFEMYLSQPRDGSFVLSVRLGASGQSPLLGFGKAEPIIDELFDCFELFNRGEDGQLRERITNEAYFTNFISLAGAIAPDGDAVRWVGFTRVRGNEERRVELTRTARAKIGSRRLATQRDVSAVVLSPSVEVRGVLLEADGRGGTDKVRIVNESGQKLVHVPAGADDLVKRYWREEVIVVGQPGPRGSMILEAIRPV